MNTNITPQPPVLMRPNTFDDDSPLLDRVVRLGEAEIEEPVDLSGISLWKCVSERFWGRGRVSQEGINALSEIARSVSSAVQPPERAEIRRIPLYQRRTQEVTQRRIPLYQRRTQEVSGDQLKPGMEVQSIKTAEVSVLEGTLVERTKQNVQYSNKYVQELLSRVEAKKKETGVVSTHLLNDIQAVVTEFESRGRLTPKEGAYLARLHRYLF
ncbi:MAG: hypothetical protein ACPG5T_03420 [Endozoicomonas sp.]